MALRKKIKNFLNFFLEKIGHKIVKVSQLELSIPGEINNDEDYIDEDFGEDYD